MKSAVEITAPTASVAIVSLIGEHDLSGQASLKAAFTKAAIRAPHVIVDLSLCEFIDSTVISVLVSAQRVLVRDRGTLLVALPAEPNPVTRVADLMHLADMFPIYDSLEAALASLQPAAELADAQPVSK